MRSSATTPPQSKFTTMSAHIDDSFVPPPRGGGGGGRGDGARSERALDDVPAAIDVLAGDDLDPAPLSVDQPDETTALGECIELVALDDEQHRPGDVDEQRGSAVLPLQRGTA